MRSACMRAPLHLPVERRVSVIVCLQSALLVARNVVLFFFIFVILCRPDSYIGLSHKLYIGLPKSYVPTVGLPLTNSVQR